MPPAAAAALPAIGGAATGIGAGVAGFALGKDVEYSPEAFKDSKEYNPNAFQYGGHTGGAAEAAGRYANTSNDYNAQARYATDQAYGALGAAYNDRNNAAGARGEQQTALGLMRARATGAAPSIAGMQAQRDMEMARAAQTSAAASARGPAAMALAQQNAAANMGAQQQGISRDAQIAAAQERLAAEQAYMGGASGIRQQDYAGAQQATGMANTAAGMSGQFQQTGLGYTRMENEVQRQQVESQMRQQGMLMNDAARKQEMELAIKSGNTAAYNQRIQGMMDFMGKGAQAGGMAAGMSQGGGARSAGPASGMSSATGGSGVQSAGGGGGYTGHDGKGSF
jgi:hypothetical protein